MPVHCPQDGIPVDTLLDITNNLVLSHTGVTPHGAVLSLADWSAMFAIRWVFFLMLFWRKSGCSESKVFIPLSAHGLTSLPCPYRLHRIVLNTHHLSHVAKCHGIVALLLLCGDVSLNHGPISFGAVNCRSVRNKGPCINDTASAHSVDILAVTETHICREDTDSLLHSFTRKKSATNPVFMAVGGGVLSTKLYSLDLWVVLHSARLKILALQLGHPLNCVCYLVFIVHLAHTLMVS